MNIDNEISDLISKGLPEEQLRSIKEIADQIPISLISLKMGDLSSEDSLVKMSHLLGVLAKKLDIYFDHVNVIEKAAYPELEASISRKTQNEQKARRNNNSSAPVEEEEKFYEAEQ